MKLPVQVGPVEPHAFQRALLSLSNGQLEDRRPARPEQNRSAHLGNNARHLACLQFVEAARILPVLIAEGQVVQQVFGRQNAFGSQHLRHARPHALHIHHRSVETSHTQDAKWRLSAATNQARFSAWPWARPQRAFLPYSKRWAVESTLHPESCQCERQFYDLRSCLKTGSKRKSGS